MKIEEQIKEVQKYFIDKILNQNFKKENNGLNEIILILDNQYKFEFYFDFQEKIVFQLSGIFRNNFLDLELSKEEEEQIYKIFQSDIEGFLEKERAEKMAEYEKLKKELNL